MSHTPGPWIVVHEPKEPAPWAVTAAGYYIASLHRGTPADAEAANARLIAASPDLLAVLKECAELLDDYSDVNDGDDGQPRPNRAMSLLQDVEAVIAKAEGHLDTHPSSERQRAR